MECLSAARTNNNNDDDNIMKTSNSCPALSSMCNTARTRARRPPAPRPANGEPFHFRRSAGIFGINQIWPMATFK